MKIVFMNPVGVIGGAEKVLLTVLAALVNAQPGIQLHLILGTDGPLVDSAQNLGAQVKVLKLPEEVNQLGDSKLKGNKLLAGLRLIFDVATTLPAIRQYVVEFRQTIREINPDLIHSNGIKTHLITALAGSMGDGFLASHRNSLGYATTRHLRLYGCSHVLRSQRLSPVSSIFV